MNSTDAATGSGLAPEQGHVDYSGHHLYQFSEGAVTDAGCPRQPSFSCLQQVSNRRCPANDQSLSSKYFQMRQENDVQTLFPKPIYSYSTLIFMALMNSKTGCLPVSEIYSFMSEHFPYFKTAPDGWKNSVRHNLSLNKCFVKIENKSGNPSRKGCLWTLNPAKVEKMREELHKWRRKDPITVRRSMARPECLDRLLGERPNKFRHCSSTALSPRVAPSFNAAAPSRPPAQPHPSSLSTPRAPCAHLPPQQSHYYAPASAHAGSNLAIGSLNSPTAGMLPPVYSGTLQAGHSVSPRSIQDFVMEGYTGYDVDALNPSLTDLQLQGNVWEELQEDCLASDPQVVPPSCLQAPASSICQRMCEDQNGDSAEHLEHHCFLNGPHPAANSRVELLAGYVSTCTTSISLM
ncbi:Forkhead box protein N1 [Takifugu flavidus]|uniref:Forkhead box protein N1 n=1 Tax=Takifugu flavidus TaxID=433684 RepID=A0A5C6PCZ3_9TELE|nr:Forkhead box protein N1 [Takifugu flavidus]